MTEAIAHIGYAPPIRRDFRLVVENLAAAQHFFWTCGCVPIRIQRQSCQVERAFQLGSGKVAAIAGNGQILQDPRQQDYCLWLAFEFPRVLVYFDAAQTRSSRRIPRNVINALARRVPNMTYAVQEFTGRTAASG